jgi:serine phosphatase RsbU (regulator of sigma subunit)
MGCASPPKTEGFYISQQMISRQQTSEVLVDYINLPGRRVAAYVLDVEGSTCAVERSVRAARLMVESLVTTCSATEAVQNLAEQLDSDPQGQADTVAAGVVIVDQERSTVSIATNGQCPGLVVKAGHVESDTSELSACCRRAVTHEAGEFEDIPLQEDECLVLFSEGVTRLIGGNGQLLSTTELGALVENALTDATGNPESAIVQALNRYRGVTPLADDIAVIVVSRDGQSSFRATQVGGDTRMDVQEQK